MNIIDNDLLSIQEARILAENAREAQARLAAFPQKKLDEIVERMAEEISKHAKELAELSSDETDYGIAHDKYIKNLFASEYVAAKIRHMKCVGIISEDKENMTKDVGVPVGVIVALCPATSPVSTAIYKTLIAIKAGNAIIFSPHPRAKKTMMRTLDILIKAAEGYGLPKGSISYLEIVTASGTKELINHSATSLIMNTGVPRMLDAAYHSGKPVIYGGTGNGPAFIERTADIKQAVKDIIASKTFDNGVVSGAEQSIVVDSPVDSEVRKELMANGAYFMTTQEAEFLSKVFYRGDGTPDPEILGKTALQLAKRAGINAPADTKVLISEQKFVYKENPYAKEKLSPVLSYYIEDDWMHACEKCIELLLTEKQGHTLVIHSNDEAVIEQFALKKPVGRILVNTPAIFGSMGITTNLFPAMTLGSGSAGHGMTSDNVSPMNLIYIRKVGYGVRSAQDFVNTVIGGDTPAEAVKKEEQGGVEILQKLLQQILEK